MSTQAKVQNQMVYFVSGMWCTTCAKTVREAVMNIDGVVGAQLNYASKLLLVNGSDDEKGELDRLIRLKIERIGFSVKRQAAGWIQTFKIELEREMNDRLSWLRVSLVWFFAMWSSMIAFTGYMGGLTPSQSYALAVATSVFGIPAILMGAVPYAKSGLRSLFHGHRLTLDLFIFLGAVSAVSVSLIFLLSHMAVTYADSGAMVIAFLLLTKKIENTVVGKVTSALLFQIHPSKDKVRVLKKDGWREANVAQVKKGDRVRILPAGTIPFDGQLESAAAEINSHLLNGENLLLAKVRGDHLLAGSVSASELEMTVIHPQGQRMIDDWAEAALLSGNRESVYSRVFSRIEESLVALAFGGAVFIAGWQWFKGASPLTVVESFFVGILIFCPCLFASIIPLTRQMVHLALQRIGVNLHRSEALLDLHRVNHVCLDKTGTLEAVESGVEMFDEKKSLVKEEVYALAKRSSHPILRSLGHQADVEIAFSRVNEIPGEGIEAFKANGDRLLVGSFSFMRERGIEPPPSADPDLPVVAVNEKAMGQILVKRIYDEKSKTFLSKLMDLLPRVKVEILSGDPNLAAGKGLTSLSGKLSYRGNMKPAEKAEKMTPRSVFIGDGLNDTLALAKAGVSFRLGDRVLGFAPVDFQLQVPRLDLILKVFMYARKYRRILVQMLIAAFIYNVIALSLATMGFFSPLGAVVAMFVCFTALLLSSLRLLKVPGGMS